MPVTVYIDPGSHTLEPFAEAEEMLIEIFEEIGCDGHAKALNNKFIPPIQEHIKVGGIKLNGVLVKLRGRAQLSRHYSLLRMNGLTAQDMQQKLEAVETILEERWQLRWRERPDQKKGRKKELLMDNTQSDDQGSGAADGTPAPVEKPRRRSKLASERGVSKNRELQVAILTAFYRRYGQQEMFSSAASLFLVEDIPGRSAKGVSIILGHLAAAGLFHSRNYSTHDKILRISEQGYELLRDAGVALDATLEQAALSTVDVVRALKKLGKPALAKKAALDPLIAEEQRLKELQDQTRADLERVRQRIMLLEQTQIPDHVTEAAKKYWQLKKEFDL